MKSTLLKITLFSLLFIGCKTSNKENPHHLEASILNKDSSKKNLDWAGTYVGTIPCADCSGIKTKITIKKDLTYTKQVEYLGKDTNKTITKDQFTWNDLENTINIENVSYMVGKNTLIQLNKQKESIDGALATKYVLQKIATDTKLTEVKWYLIELVGKPIKAAQKNIPNLTLDSNNNRVSGFTGCNSISGNYDLKFGNRLSFSKTISTKKHCFNNPYETAFLGVIEKIDNYTIHNDTLSLHKAKMAPLAKFVRVK
ncbi:heat shock protein HslJ [Wenyingzhuangia heitensis]|uniref:Heat shock protein HslJ n=1 Tax=Wenyingzhuangia heitensis TaxID=1487859 RepID=A0ABX0UCI0_9FLAO|nr:META domain-containing protein [Wenyingzhuangia heitensis]NIJ45520.1 heat shock protein HslJ [Wenyingzhuangia heitensis]